MHGFKFHAGFSCFPKMVKGAKTVVFTVLFRMVKDIKTIIGSCKTCTFLRQNPEWDDMKTFMFLFPKPQCLFSIYKTDKGYKTVNGKVNLINIHV